MYLFMSWVYAGGVVSASVENNDSPFRRRAQVLQHAFNVQAPGVVLKNYFALVIASLRQIS